MTDLIPRSDAELLEDIRKGDPGTLARLQAGYWNRLLRFADGIVQGRADPQDVVQEAFIRLWTHRERWDARGSLRSLLYTLTRNAALDELRSWRRAEKAADAVTAPAAPPAPSDAAVAAELRRAAASAVAGLPPLRREVFRLAREEGLTYGEIAEVLGLSPQTVANHMSLALADLRRALAPYLPERGPPP
ncbi:MAG: sigma-70 family RNA polymerase sigma factor [Gemmatimonadetes bacterium]|nr:sigma-70 family RNA polymerase sigma factor [Gemmatimonadota bacterium]